MHSFIHCFVFLKLHTMKTSRKKTRSWDPALFFLRALNLRTYLIYIPVNKVWLYRPYVICWCINGMKKPQECFQSCTTVAERDQPIFLNLCCTVYIVRCSLGLDANSFIIGDGSKATFSHPYSVGFSSPSSNNVHCTVWRWSSMEVSSSVSRWQSFGFQSLTSLNQPASARVCS